MSEKADKKFIKTTFDILLKEGIPQTIIDEMYAKIKDEKLELTKEQIQYFADEIYNGFQRALITPGEPIGTVAAQSIGEPGTQMSIAGNEKVIISIDEIPQIVEIGKIVDDFFRIFSDKVYRIGNSEILNISEELNIKAASIDENEKFSWNLITQFSRHNPNGKLLKIQTRTGRKILATKSHSFIIRNDNKIISIKGEDLNIDDRLPIAKHIESESYSKLLNLKEILPPSLYWFGSEVEKAKKLYAIEGRNWKKFHNIEYTTPVKTDAMRLVLKGETMVEIESGYIYPSGGKVSDVRIPEVIVLNEIVGYFFGAYLSEGSITPYYVSIANIDDDFNEQIKNFAERFSIGINQRIKEGEFGTSISNILSSALLVELVKNLCGSGSNDKFIDYRLLFSNDVAASALLRAYFDGDGNVNSQRDMIRASSNSLDLINGISLMLVRFGIYPRISKNKKQYNLVIPKQYIRKFYENIGFHIKSKQTELKRLIKSLDEEEKIKPTYDSVDMIPNFGQILKNIKDKLKIKKSDDEILCASIRKWTRNQKIGRRRLISLIEEFNAIANDKSININNEINILKNAVNGDFLWDSVISIDEVNCPTNYVYDFSVEKTENFMLLNGLITHNTLRTFHFAGVSEFSVTQGLPRLIEIVDARRNPSTPIMHVFLNKEYAADKKKAKQMHSQIEQIRIDSIAYDVEIDLSDYTIDIYLDPELLEDKEIDINDIPKKLKKFKKKGEIEVDEDNYVIKINPEIDDIQKLQKMREKILKTIISGLKGVIRGIIYKDDETDDWKIQTEGTNLSGVLKLKGVDKEKTISNHIHEVEKIFGVEAARTMIIREAEQVLKDQGLEVDHRHLLAMADLMCHSGRILQIGRHGISGVKESILARAAFEVTIKQLLNASISGEEEKLKGIPENVIVGQLVPTIGTGAVHLQADLERYKEILDERNKSI